MYQNQDNLTVTDVGVKAKSKVEVYRVLTTEGRIYLPLLKECNYQYICDIITGNKLCIKGKDVICTTVPWFKGLSIAEICEWAESKCFISKYLPEVKREIKFPNRPLKCNVVNSLINQDFQNFIKCAYKCREEQLICRKSLKVDALPEFAKLFKSSQSVSYELRKVPLPTTESKEKKGIKDGGCCKRSAQKENQGIKRRVV